MSRAILFFIFYLFPPALFDGTVVDGDDGFCVSGPLGSAGRLADVVKTISIVPAERAGKLARDIGMSPQFASTENFRRRRN